MSDFPEDYYNLLAVASDKTRLRESTRAGVALVGPCYLRYTLPPYLEMWATSNSIPFGSVVEACIELGQYIHRAYPRARESGTPYAVAILNTDRLMARTARARDNTVAFIDQARALISRAELRGNLVGFPATAKPAKICTVDAGLSSDHDDPIMPVVANEVIQPFSGKAIMYLFNAALVRGQTPSELLIHCVATGLYLDRNIYLHKSGTSLTQLLILKALAIEKLARELDNTLSALETLLVDWPTVYATIEHRLNRFLEGMHA